MDTVRESALNGYQPLLIQPIGFHLPLFGCIQKFFKREERHAMKLSCFEAVYAAANKLYFMGESLIGEVDGVTVAIRHIDSAPQQIEVLYVSREPHNHQSNRFIASNFHCSGLENMQVAKSCLSLLIEGEGNGK